MVNSNNAKLDYTGLLCDVICHQRMDIFNNLKVLDDYQHILIDEFTMMTPELLIKLVFWYKCKPSQTMIFCGDVFQ